MLLKSKVEGKIKALKKLPMKTKIVIAVGLAGILLIFVSEMFPAKIRQRARAFPRKALPLMIQTATKADRKRA